MQNLFTQHPPSSASFGHASNADFALGVQGFKYSDLYKPERLRALAEAFYAEVKARDEKLHEKLSEYVKSRGENLAGTRAESDLLIAAAPYLSDFIARRFDVSRERQSQIEAVKAQDAVWEFKY